MIAVSSLTYLSVERPAQGLGRRLSRRLDARFGPDRIPATVPEQEGARESRGRRPPSRPTPSARGVRGPGSAGEQLPRPRERGAPYQVLVCLGNICRSPMAETVLRAELAAASLAETARAVVVDSAGTGDWHVGDAMDPGARSALASRGHDGSAHRARQFQPSWLSRA